MVVAQLKVRILNARLLVSDCSTELVEHWTRLRPLVGDDLLRELPNGFLHETVRVVEVVSMMDPSEVYHQKRV